MKNHITNGICRFCGKESSGHLFDEWVKDTFTDFDKLKMGTIICNDCLFWFDEKSAILQERMGKDKLQKMRTYSHFIVNGEWHPLSKADKDKMLAFLVGDNFPELAAISDSGQRHIVFRAVRNDPGQRAGWVQFETQRIYVKPEELKSMLSVVVPMLSTFSKTEIASGDYLGHRIFAYGFDKWEICEDKIKTWRGTPLFSLAIFLAKGLDNEQSETAGSDASGDGLEGNAAGLQDEVQDVDLAAVRGQHQKRGLHKQPGEVSQLALFETECGDRQQRKRPSRRR